MPATLFEVNNITKISDFSLMYGTERTVPFGFLALNRPGRDGERGTKYSAALKIDIESGKLTFI